MSLPQIIGLSGKKQNGKSTTANWLTQHYGYEQVSFGAALKEAVSIIFGFPMDKFEDGVWKETVDPFWGVTPRHILETVGTRCLRDNFRQDIWVKVVERKLANYKYRRIVLTDVRFPTEVDAIRSWGGEIWRLVHPDRQSGSTSVPETALDTYALWDHQLIAYNVPELEALVEAIMKSKEDT